MMLLFETSANEAILDIYPMFLMYILNFLASLLALHFFFQTVLTKPGLVCFNKNVNGLKSF